MVAEAGLIPILLLIIEDIFVWKSGQLGVPIVIAVGISMVIFYFYWAEVTMLLKKLLNWLGFNI